MGFLPWRLDSPPNPDAGYTNVRATVISSRFEIFWRSVWLILVHVRSIVKQYHVLGVSQGNKPREKKAKKKKKQITPLRSIPAQNALFPAPVIIPTRLPPKKKQALEHVHMIGRALVLLTVVVHYQTNPTPRPFPNLHRRKANSYATPGG